MLKALQRSISSHSGSIRPSEYFHTFLCRPAHEVGHRFTTPILLHRRTVHEHATPIIVNLPPITVDPQPGRRLSSININIVPRSEDPRKGRENELDELVCQIQTTYTFTSLTDHRSQKERTLHFFSPKALELRGDIGRLTPSQEITATPSIAAHTSSSTVNIPTPKPDSSSNDTAGKWAGRETKVRGLMEKIKLLTSSLVAAQPKDATIDPVHPEQSYIDPSPQLEVSPIPPNPVMESIGQGREAAWREIERLIEMPHPDPRQNAFGKQCLEGEGCRGVQLGNRDFQALRLEMIPSVLGAIKGLKHRWQASKAAKEAMWNATGCRRCTGRLVSAYSIAIYGTDYYSKRGG